MSLPQIKLQLFGHPTSLAGDAGTLTQGRSDAILAGTVFARSLSSQADTLSKVCIGCNLEVSMPTSRDAFLGHACVSPPGVEDHSTPDGSDECSSAVAQIRKGKPGR